MKVAMTKRRCRRERRCTWSGGAGGGDSAGQSGAVARELQGRR